MQTTCDTSLCKIRMMETILINIKMITPLEHKHKNGEKEMIPIVSISLPLVLQVQMLTSGRT